VHQVIELPAVVADSPPAPSIAPPPKGPPDDNMLEAVRIIEERLRWGDDRKDQLDSIHSELEAK